MFSDASWVLGARYMSCPAKEGFHSNGDPWLELCGFSLLCKASGCAASPFNPLGEGKLCSVFLLHFEPGREHLHGPSPEGALGREEFGYQRGRERPSICCVDERGPNNAV